MKAMSSAQQSEVKAWEEEILPCEHTLTLYQEPLITDGQCKLVCTVYSKLTKQYPRIARLAS